MTGTIKCYVSLSTNNLKNLCSNFNIPYKKKYTLTFNGESMDSNKTMGEKNIVSLKSNNIKYKRSLKFYEIKYIKNYNIFIDFFEKENDSNETIISNKASKEYLYFFSDKKNKIRFENEKFKKKIIIIREDLRNNLFSKLFPSSILEKNQNEIADGKNQDYGYLTFTENSKPYNIIPPFAFTSKRKNKEIMIESILLGISIMKQQEEIKKPEQQILKKLSSNNVYNSIESPFITVTNQKNKSLKPIKCMIITHNSILRCFLDKITKDGDVFLNTRFKNNVILKITVKEYMSSLEMISEGNLDSKKEEKENLLPKNKYFIKNDFGHYYTNLDSYWNILGYNLEIYIVRHGVAYHNIRNVFTKHLVYDTSLVPNQNKISEVKKYIPKYTEINYFFLSPLIRTRQTLLNLYPNIENKKIVILPCSREIGSVKGDCRQEKIKPFENRTYPSNKYKPNDKKNITWDWSFYDREKGKCAEGSNMVYEMIKYIFYNEIHLT